MKNLNKKIIVPTLALAMGACLAGSISGTVAWFQYSTRAQAAFIGTSAHCSEMLEIKSLGPTATAFKTELSSSEVNNMSGYGTDLQPISSGAYTLDDAIAPANFYKNPIYQIEDSSLWGAATNANFVQLQFQLRVRDINSSSAYLAHNLYLTDLSIVSLNDAGTLDVNDDEDTTNNNDLYKAIRVHIAAGSYHKTFAADGVGTNAKVSTDTHGQLDLNNDGKLDTNARYEWNAAGTVINYGGTSAVQEVNNASKTGMFADDSDPSAIASHAGTAGLIGAIPANENGLTVTVTMWIEGWTKLSEPVAGNYDSDPNNDGNTADKQASVIWDPATYLGKKFGVGLRFATELHADNATEHPAP